MRRMLLANVQGSHDRVTCMQKINIFNVQMLTQRIWAKVPPYLVIPPGATLAVGHGVLALHGFSRRLGDLEPLVARDCLGYPARAGLGRA